MSEPILDAEAVARTALSNIAAPMHRIFTDPVYAELLDALDVLLDQEVWVVEQLIRDRDAESRATLLRAGGIAALRLAARDHEIQDNRPWVEWWLNNRADEISEAANG